MGQEMQFNYIITVGEEERTTMSVEVRDRERGRGHTRMLLDDFIAIALERNNPFFK
jgi:threonyl-tRNA synthetase